MKKTLLFICMIAFSKLIMATDKELNISLGASYANQVFVKLGTDQTTTIAAADWDIMFQRTSSYSFSIRVNNARIQVYEALNNYTSAVTTTQWNSIDVANQTAWQSLYNSDTIWTKGAFDNVVIPDGTSGYPYGWGYYDMSTHKIFGSAVFVLKYTDGTYMKFKIDQYSAGYTISFATWDAVNSVWGETTTNTIANTTGTGLSYNYFSFTTNSVVTSVPADTDWDVKFGQYYTDLGTQMYKVTGVLHGYTTKVATMSDNTVPAETDFSAKINTIGYDWKTYNMSTASYNISDKKFFVKSSDGTTYKMWFTSFEGSATGNITLKYTTDITSAVENTQISKNLIVSYSKNSKQVLIKNAPSAYQFSIYSLNGQNLMNVTSNSDAISVSDLRAGIYIVKIKTGEVKINEKLIIQ